MTDAPERVDRADWIGNNYCEGVNIWSGPSSAYILATPEALAAAPEVQALIREAEARGMERAADVDWSRGREVSDTAPDFLSDWQRGFVSGQDAMRKAIRAEAAAIRAKDTP